VSGHQASPLGLVVQGESVSGARFNGLAPIRSAFDVCDEKESPLKRAEKRRWAALDQP